MNIEDKITDRHPDDCVWGEPIDGSPFYWCSLNKTPCRYATRCSFEKKEDNDNDD